MNRPDLDGNRIILDVAGEVNPTSPRARFAVDGAQVERCYYIRHDPEFTPDQMMDRIAKVFLGYAQRANSAVANFRYIKRMTPLPDPARPNCWCTSISNLEIVSQSETVGFTSTTVQAEQDGPRVGAAVPFARRDFRLAGAAAAAANANVNVIEKGLWRLTAVFTGLTYDVRTDAQLVTDVVTASAASNIPGLYINMPGEPDEGAGVAYRVPRYVTITGDYTPRMLKFPQGSMYTVNAGPGEISEAVPDGFAVARSDQGIQMVWHCVPANCVPEIFHGRCIQHINSALFHTSPTGTLLLEGIRLVPHISPLMQRIYDVHYTFRRRAIFDNVDSPAGPGAPRYRGWNYAETVRGTKMVLRRVNSSKNGLGTSPFYNQTFVNLFRPDLVNASLQEGGQP